MTTVQTEAWQRGPVPGFDPLLMPVVHALIQAREDLERLIPVVPPDHVWTRPGNAASLGYHVRHAGGALDRLFTYARGEGLSDGQRAALKSEGAPGEPAATLAMLVVDVNRIIDAAMEQLRVTRRDSLLEDRKVGRAGLPATVLGLLFHAAEHTTRHVGQAITTALVQRS
jgi:hypothetical protein